MKFSWWGPKNLFSCNVVYIIFWTFCDEKQFAKFLSLALSGERHKGRSWDQQSLFRHQGQGGEVNTANKKQSSFDQLFSVLFSIVQCTIIPRFSWQHCLPIIFVCFFIFWKGAVPKPSDWISLFVCLFVCLFTCLLERKGWPEVWWQEEDTPSDQQSTCSILLFFHFDFVFSCTLTAQ